MFTPVNNDFGAIQVQALQLYRSGAVIAGTPGAVSLFCVMESTTASKTPTIVVF
jgi:hypothetical protein